MLQVTFKDNYKQVYSHNDRVVRVLITGVLQLPDWWFSIIPANISNWTFSQPNIDAKMFGGNLLLTVQGKAMCSPNDTYDLDKGEKIALCRAKITLYNYVYELLNKVFNYLRNILIGDADFRLPEVYSSGLLKYIRKYSMLSCRERNRLYELINF